VVDSIVINSIDYNCNISNSTEINVYCTDSILGKDSDIRDTTVINSWLFNVNASENSLINNSILENCIIINSTVKNYYGKDCYFVNSIADPPTPLYNVTGSNITDSEIYYSNVTYSNVSDGSYIEDSNINGSNIVNGSIWDSDINSSNITDSKIQDCNIRNSTVINSTKVNSTIINSTVINSTNINCDVINGIETGNTCENDCGDLQNFCNISAGECLFCDRDCFGNKSCCGDGYCVAVIGETYLTCSQDCAAPPPPSPPVRRVAAGGAFLTACYENWECNDWGPCLPNGTQTRECWDLNSCDEKYDMRIISRVYTTKRPSLVQNCTYVAATCYDGIKNQDETDIDCGGSVCSRCGDGKSCLRDRDCINSCDIDRGICYTPVPPVVEVPKPTLFDRIIGFIVINWLYLLILLAIIIIVIGVYTYLNLEKMAFYQKYMAKKEERVARVRRRAEEEKKRLIELERKRREAIKELHRRLRKEYAHKLELFLDKAVDKGYRKTNIKNALISKGWPKDFVNKYVDAYFKEHHVRIRRMEKEMEKTADYAKLQAELEHINTKLKGKK